MAGKRKIRETKAPYSAQPLSEVFLLAFKSLPEEEKNAFLQRLLADPEVYEEVIDAIAMLEAKDEPSRPFSEFDEELRREGRL